MGYLAPGEMFDNMLQLMRFSVYNYDSLIVRTVAFPVQVAYWI